MSVIVGYNFSLPTPQTYASLQASLAQWLNRSDLTAIIPDFIRLAEERLNRDLRVRQMEVPLSQTPIVSNVIAVPLATVGVKTLWVVGSESEPLKPQTYEYVIAQATGSTATHYAWQGDTFCFNGSGTVTGVLYQQIPSLSATQTSNWLLSQAPSAYLYGAMREAYDYLRDDVERDRWAARLQSVVDSLQGVEKRDLYSGPLVARAR